MKLLSMLVLLLLLSFNVKPQSQKAFKYQAVVRDSNGSIISNQNISLKVSLMEGRMDGMMVFSEVHQTETNSYGLINISIGNGDNLFGSLESIHWGDSSYFMRMELDETGGTNYHFMGVSQILYVPVALYAERSGDTTKWRKDTTNIYYNKGNVGIGTSSPSELLHLQKESILDTNHVGLRFSNPYTNGNSWFLGIRPIFDPSGFSIISDSSSSNPSIYIGKSGKVGIGKHSPEYELDIEGSIYTSEGIHFSDGSSIASASGFWGASGNCIFMEEDNVVIGNSSCSQYKLFLEPDTNGLGLSINGISKINKQGTFNIIHPNGAIKQLGFFNDIENEPFGYGIYIDHQAETDTITKWTGIYVNYAFSDSNRYAAIFKNGNVGIGTDNPKYNLHVEGNSLINGNLGINKLNPEYALDMGGDLRVKDLIIGDSSSPNIKFNIIGSNFADAAKIEIGKGMNDQSKTLKLITRTGGAIQFFTDSKIRMQIRDTAIIIGRPVPDKLVDLNVNGKIMTREVEVEIGYWWDNVFSKEYQLPPLEEIEAFINENHHLPRIPSEAKILEQGLKLGEMNGLLLKKIEELTLYLIEIKKENKQLALEIENLKKLK